ncbi:MAG: hypothetical protein AB7H80_03585 [Candidatus Kapaibacterium sp.]
MAQTSATTWQNVEQWVKFYSWITVAAVIYGFAAAHVPFIIGHPWSSCKVSGSDCACVLVFHLFEVPLVSFNAFIAWYGLKKFSLERVERFSSLLSFAFTVNLLFFAFEICLMLDGLRRQAPDWENYALLSVALILVFGAGLSLFLKQKIVGWIEDGKSTT